MTNSRVCPADALLMKPLPAWRTSIPLLWLMWIISKISTIPSGTSLVIDPRRDLIVVLLTNRVHPTRDGPSINAARQAVANAALAAAGA